MRSIYSSDVIISCVSHDQLTLMVLKSLAPYKVLVEWLGFLCIVLVTVACYIITSRASIRDVEGATVLCTENCKPKITREILSLKPRNITDESEMAPVSCDRGIRERHLESVCDQWKTVRHIRFQDPGTYWAMLVDDTHKVLYCIIPKAGCTSFQTMIVNHTGQFHETDPMAVHDPDVLAKFNFSYLHTYPFEEIIWRLEHYFKFLVVRNPFERLYSAYIDKAFKHPEYQQRFDRTIRKYFPSLNPQNTSVPLTFSQFVNLIVHEYDTSLYKDRHWATFDEICHPCDIKYDYIGKLETLDQDLANLLPRFKTKEGNLLRLPKLHASYKGTHKPMTSSEAYKQVSPGLLRRLYSLYQMDFKLFGYSWGNYSSGNCAIKNGDENCC